MGFAKICAVFVKHGLDFSLKKKGVGGGEGGYRGRDGGRVLLVCYWWEASLDLKWSKVSTITTSLVVYSTLGWFSGKKTFVFSLSCITGYCSCSCFFLSFFWSGISWADTWN